MDVETIVLAITGIFWTILIGSLLYRFEVPHGERKEYDRAVVYFAYATAMLTIGSVLFWLGDEPWTAFLAFCLEKGAFYIRAIFLGLFYAIAFMIIVLYIWKRRVKEG